MQWSSKARELMRKECIEYSIDLELAIHETYEEINKEREKYGFKPLKRITKEIVEQTILNIIVDTPPGGENQEHELKDFAYEVMYQ